MTVAGEDWNSVLRAVSCEVYDVLGLVIDLWKSAVGYDRFLCSGTSV